MSIPPSKTRCEKKLGEIQALKQKGNNSADELEKIGKESYYRNALEHISIQEVPLAQATIVCPEHSVMVRCNYTKNVYKHIQTGKKYVIEMPNIHTVLNVTCIFAACRAADMYIDEALVNGRRDHGVETCTISYNYDNFDSIYYTSFERPDACYVYAY